MVCEACEFQDHYLSMAPAVSVILNVDADHLDYFGTLENIIKSFSKFASLASRAVIVNADDENSLRAVKDITCKELITFGKNGERDWSSKNIRMIKGSYCQYDLYHKSEFFASVRLGVPGIHNVTNSMAAAAAAFLCGATAEQIVKGLESFKGAGRRFEFLGTFGGITVADDYAHHPTEIAATLSAAKAMGYQRVWAVFQPFTFSRTARHLDGFVESLSAADEVVLSDIMGSREINTWNVSSKQITVRIPGAVYLPTFPQIADYVAENAGEGDLVLTMGGGDVYKCARMIVKLLQDKVSDNAV
jgi:UDP-N-acetylmuramate--alanine ligase